MTAAGPAGDAVGIEWVRFESASGNGFVPQQEKDEPPMRLRPLRTFELGRTEVTVAQYARCVEARACPRPAEAREAQCNWGQPARADHPMNCVTFAQALGFARWVGGRLPTEVEWFYAVQGGEEDQRWPWGEEAPTCRHVVGRLSTEDGCPVSGTEPVCNRASGRSAQGLCDLIGNVDEWLSEGPDPVLEWPVQRSDLRLTAGGGFCCDPVLAPRDWLREGSDPNLSTSERGFRVARDGVERRAAKDGLQAEVAKAFGTLQAVFESPPEVARPALEAFLDRYEARARPPWVAEGWGDLVDLPEVALAQRALAALGNVVEARNGLEWVRVPAGITWKPVRGSQDPSSDSVRVFEAAPQASFALSRAEVTVAQYRRCVEAGACKRPRMGDGCHWGVARREHHPVNCVNWAQAKAFAAWAGGRLPTSAEWTRAATNGLEVEASADSTAVYGRTIECSNGRSAAVCADPRDLTDAELCDLAGNVAEWVEDKWVEEVWEEKAFYDEQSGVEVTEPVEMRVVRRLCGTETVWEASGTSPEVGFRVASGSAAVRARVTAGELDEAAQGAERAQAATRAFKVIERQVARPKERSRAAIEAFLDRFEVAPAGAAHLPEVEAAHRALVTLGGRKEKRTGLEWMRASGGPASGGPATQKASSGVGVISFELGRTEVTVDQFGRCVKARACTAPQAGEACNWGHADRAQHPVNCVTTAQAETYARWAGGRLPTEAEHALARRSPGSGAGDRAADGSGDVARPAGEATAEGRLAPGCAHAIAPGRMGEVCVVAETTAVCGGGAAPTGFCDLAGNVSEWLASPGAPSVGEAQSAPAVGLRVARDGPAERARRARRRAAGLALGDRIAWALIPERPAASVERAVGERVTAFELTRSEVTNGQYGDCVRAGACTPLRPSVACVPGALLDAPATCVDWEQAETFARWVGGRLPSPAEWAHATRGGDGSQAYPWGDERPTCERVVMDELNERYGGGADSTGCFAMGPLPVCLRPKGHSAQGVCDLLGNVSEWLGGGGNERQYAGGSWADGALEAKGTRAAAAATRSDRIGFRVARAARAERTVDAGEPGEAVNADEPGEAVDADEPGEMTLPPDHGPSGR